MRLIDADEIKKREHDVVLANGAKHRCFDTTMLYEIPTVDVDSLNAKHEGIGYEKGFRDGYAEALEETDNVPDKNVGKWIDAWRSAWDGTRHWYRECSECGYERDDDNIDKDTKFCPNCGAYMGVEDVQESD